MLTLLYTHIHRQKQMHVYSVTFALFCHQKTQTNLHAQGEGTTHGCEHKGTFKKTALTDVMNFMEIYFLKNWMWHISAGSQQTSSAYGVPP